MSDDRTIYREFLAAAAATILGMGEPKILDEVMPRLIDFVKTKNPTNHHMALWNVLSTGLKTCDINVQYQGTLPSGFLFKRMGVYVDLSTVSQAAVSFTHAQNVGTSAAESVMLINLDSPIQAVRCAAASHANATERVLLKALVSNHMEVRASAEENPNMTPEVLQNGRDLRAKREKDALALFGIAL
jgi:hypothetical protein